MPQFLALLHRVCRPTVAAATADAATAADARRPAMPSQPVFPPNLACFLPAVFLILIKIWNSKMLILLC